MLRRSGAAALACLRQHQGAAPWQLRCLPVCASTELELTAWLAAQPWDGVMPRAVVARRQIRGQGQWGRPWQAPPGGVWVSAALPWSGPGVAAGLFGLAVAVGLAERLEAAGLTVAIKWPNDLLVDGRKVAGILPRMVHRGSRVRLARVGLGLNVVNPVPPGAIALKQLLPSPRPLPWTAEVLTALERAMDLATVPEAVVEATEARLWARTVNDPSTAELWTVEGLAQDGALRLRHGTRTTSWTRWGDLSSSGL